MTTLLHASLTAVFRSSRSSGSSPISSATPASTPRTSVKVSGRESSSRRTAAILRSNGAISVGRFRPSGDRPGSADLAVRMLLSFVCGVNLCPSHGFTCTRALQDRAPARRVRHRHVASLPKSSRRAVTRDARRRQADGQRVGHQRHRAREPRARTIRSCLICGQRRRPVRVLDHGTGFAKRVAHARWRGWGLRVVEQLSDRWGMPVFADRTEVWFERALRVTTRRERSRNWLGRSRPPPGPRL